MVLADGPIIPADLTCVPFLDPPTYIIPNPDYDPEQCPIYFQPLLMESPSSASSQYEQVDGRDALCIVSPLSSTASDKFFMTYFGTLSSDVTDTCKSLVCGPGLPLSHSSLFGTNLLLKPNQIDLQIIQLGCSSLIHHYQILRSFLMTFTWMLAKALRRLVPSNSTPAYMVSLRRLI